MLLNAVAYFRPGVFDAIRNGGPAVVFAGLNPVQFVAPAREDARLYRVGAALETLLIDSWGGPLLDRAPALGGNR